MNMNMNMNMNMMTWNYITLNIHEMCGVFSELHNCLYHVCRKMRLNESLECKLMLCVGIVHTTV